jgi:hypothetical protein
VLLIFLAVDGSANGNDFVDIDMKILRISVGSSYRISHTPFSARENYSAAIAVDSVHATRLSEFGCARKGPL